MIKKCEWCGKEFDALKNAKRCPVCRKEAHPDYKREYFRRYREKNREHLNDLQRRWREKNREQRRESQSEYQRHYREEQRLKRERQRIIAKLFERRKRS